MQTMFRGWVGWLRKTHAENDTVRWVDAGLVASCAALGIATWLMF